MWHKNQGCHKNPGYHKGGGVIQTLREVKAVGGIKAEGLKKTRGGCYVGAAWPLVIWGGCCVGSASWEVPGGLSFLAQKRGLS